jgi:hypothetical protein
MFRAAIAVVSLVVVAAHMTGNMKALGAMFDIGVEAQHLPYLLAIPFVCVVGLVMLSETRNN